jgi:hypothetical protein
MISLSGFMSVVMQLLDPYFRKILRSYFAGRSEGVDHLNESRDISNMSLNIEIVEEQEESNLNVQRRNGAHNVNGDYQPPPIEMNLLKSSHFPHNYNLTKDINSDSNHTHHFHTPTFGTTRGNDMENIPVLTRDSKVIGITINQDFSQNNQIIINNPKRVSQVNYPKNTFNHLRPCYTPQAHHHNKELTISPINYKNHDHIKEDKTSENESDTSSVHSLRSDNISMPVFAEYSYNSNKFKRHSTFVMPRHDKQSLILSNEGDRTFDLMNYHLETTDNIYRMIAISISINQDRIYDKERYFKAKFDSPLPWAEEKFYKERTPCEEYKQENLPDWVNIKYDKNFKKLNLKIKKYCSLVFHHIRLIDKISVDDCIKSLDPILNLDKINESKVSGGRSPNSILYTWDRKMLIKTISKQEKILLVKEVLKNYHVRMRDTKSLLCRIYGLFRICVSDQFNTYVVLMKNMCELPLQTKVLTFDIKGSTVDRDCISPSDKKKYLELKNESESKAKDYKEEIIKINKNKVLKDNDFRFLELEFNLSSSDATNLITAVEKDSYFLEKYWITDYSLLVAVHRFRVDDYRSNFKNLRVLKSSDDKYLFSFSIIDFLTVKRKYFNFFNLFSFK